MQIVDMVLRNNFGFQSILWVYSGGRGIHCWVSDPRARVLSSYARQSIADYISKPLTDKNLDCYVGQEWYEKVEPIFQEYINRQRQYMGVDGYNDLVTKARAEFYMPKSDDVKIADTESAWPAFKREYNSATGNKSRQWRTTLQRIVLDVMRPRLDEKVTTEMNHLMKIPFSVHHRTLRVCCPLDPSASDDLMSFDPLAVPTVDQLVEMVDSKDGDLNATILKSWFAILKKYTPPTVKQETEEW
jgi:DNA primase small subunit